MENPAIEPGKYICAMTNRSRSNSSRLAQAEISSSLMKRSIASSIACALDEMCVIFFEDGSPSIFGKCGREGYVHSV